MKLNFKSEEQKRVYYDKYTVGILRTRIIIEIVLGVLVIILFPLLSYERMGNDSIVIGIIVGVICFITAVVYYIRLRKAYKQIQKDLEEENT